MGDEVPPRGRPDPQRDVDLLLGAAVGTWADLRRDHRQRQLGRSGHVEIHDGDEAFSASGCGDWIEVVAVDEPGTSFGDGRWAVGDHIAPGSHRSNGGDSCYWERLSGFSGEFDDIIANDIVEGRALVEIAPTSVVQSQGQPVRQRRADDVSHIVVAVLAALDDTQVGGFADGVGQSPGVVLRGEGVLFSVHDQGRR